MRLRAAHGVGLFVYAICFFAESVGSCLVFVFFSYGVVGLHRFFGLNEGVGSAAAVAVSVWPHASSLWALAGLRSKDFRQSRRLGAREPSKRESELLDSAFSAFPPGCIGPSKTLVIDDPLPLAFCLGATLYVNRGLIYDEALACVLAHELGHLGSLDSRLVLALRRLAYSARRITLSAICLFALRRPWYWWVRQREFAADSYAARLGFAAQLAEFLDRQLLYDLAVPAGRDRSHPYTELRIERLLAHTETDRERAGAADR